MEIVFRKANFKDLEAIINLCNECFEETTSIAYAKKLFVENASNDNHIYIVGEVDGKIVAHAKITIIPTIYEKMSTFAILNHICVKPEFRRHNLATKMLNECEKICRANKCVAMHLWSMNFREAAHECYKHYGFEVQEAKFFTKKL